ncbi:NAD-dependent epimerase/dehydratase family protein [Clostridium sp. YIM B02505]|uniref:NAD-dependent epimerase/dehydratase family protein n=1 Tax=Clostridium yunnanense TaxID=2800325 RepID=A0ABS1ETJ0_9CLOT|nr:NAD-dependent epimerase/dehydratase family protein [Clostridium yunnanense]MBK1812711.1 NAD-dependent epimerase/dehydratase family protein [Clostridium yunnanense]
MKILITGGAGFIGSHLVDKLLDEDHEVYVIDNLSTGSLENIRHNLENNHFHFVQEDICNYDVLYDLCSKCNLIFHLASSVGVKYIMDNPVKSLNSNILSSISIIKIAADLKKRIVVFSTSEIYGKNKSPELRENDDRIIGNSFRWSYSIGKAVAEYYCYAYGKEMDLDYVVIRCFNIVGPRQVGNYGMVLPRLVGQALRNEPMTVYDDGTQIRTFTHVSDLVNILCLIIENTETNKEIFNVGSSNSISIIDLANRIKAITNSLSEITFIPSREVFGSDFEDPKVRIPSADKILSIIGEYSFLDIDEIINNVVQYFIKTYNLEAKSIFEASLVSE